ncbi:hypothetical protein ACP4OV_006703 [Aristida adscensionis]
MPCDVGHVVCSPCRDKLEATTKCHVCRGPNGGYKRCHTMENLVESIDVQCPSAAHGCTARLAYYDLREHQLTCSHSPCHCPSETCDFTGSMDKLGYHMVMDHRWQFTVEGGRLFHANLRAGFNVIGCVCI